MMTESLTILVVEDNPDNMALIREILEDEEMVVLDAYQAEDGLAMLVDETVDLVAMDISLPKMNGLQATRLIKSNMATRNVPVIAITAHAMAKDRDAALAAGCDAFLTKPIDEEELVSTIRTLVGHPATEG